jgi:hypothetical protein
LLFEFQEIQQWGRENQDPELGLDMAFVSSLQLVIFRLTTPSIPFNKKLSTLASATSSDEFRKPSGRFLFWLSNGLDDDYWEKLAVEYGISRSIDIFLPLKGSCFCSPSMIKLPLSVSFVHLHFQAV